MTAMENGIGERADPSPVRTRLPAEIKRRIVELFATFQSVSQIHAAILSEFNLDLAKSTIVHYDPTRSPRLSPRLRQLFDEVRSRYVERAADVAIAHQAHRLRLLENLVAKAEKARDFGNAIKGLELAAREMGGQLTNVQKREVQGEVVHRHLTPEDAKAELAMRIGALIEAQNVTHLPSPEGTPDATES